MDDVPFISPLHEAAAGRVYDRFPGESWRGADLDAVIEVVLEEAFSDIHAIVPSWQRLQQLAIMYGWTGATPNPRPRDKALAEMWLRWVEEVGVDFVDVGAHPEVASQVPALAAAFDRRQSGKIKVKGADLEVAAPQAPTSAPQRLILPT